MRKLALMAALMLLATALIPSGMAGEGRAAPRSAQRCVLLELFSNVNNTNCADDENATARLAQDYARSRLAILEWFQAGDPLACPAAQSRYDYYLIVTPPPKAEMDGSDVTASNNNETATYNAYKSAFNSEMNKSASANITATITQNPTNATVNATVDFAEKTPGAMTLYCFVYEDGVNYAGKSNVSYHKFVVRQQAGKAILNRLYYNVGENTTALFHFDFNSSWNRANVGVVLALQSDAAHTVHQSAVFPLGAGATYAVGLSPPQQSLELFAGKDSDVTVQARNNGTATDTLDFSVNGPAASWGSLSRSTAQLAPGEQTPLTVSIAVPAGTSPGDYLLRVRGTSRTDPTKYSESAVDITVKEEVAYGVSLSPSTASEDVMAGDSATFQLRVQNTGTVTDTFDLGVQGSQASWATLSRAYIQLPANGEDTATLTVSVPGDSQAGRYDFTVKAASRSDPSQFASAQATVKVTGQGSASYGVDVEPSLITKLMSPGDSATITVVVNNTGTANDTYDLSMTGDASAWGATVQPVSLKLNAGATGQVEVLVTAPGATPAGTYSLTVRATSRGDSTKRSECAITFNVQVPEVPPSINSVSATPADPGSKDLITITAVVTGSSIDHVDVSYFENAVSHQAQRMNKNANTYILQIGPFKEKTVIRYQVTAYSTSGKTNVSNQQNVTVKANPPAAQQTPGFGALAVAAAAGAVAVLGFRRRRHQ